MLYLKVFLILFSVLFLCMTVKFIHFYFTKSLHDSVLTELGIKQQLI